MSKNIIEARPIPDEFQEDRRPVPVEASPELMQAVDEVYEAAGKKLAEATIDPEVEHRALGSFDKGGKAEDTYGRATLLHESV